MSLLALTQHARARASQRGLPHAVIDALLAYADVEVPVGGGCTCLRCSREALRAAEIRSLIGPVADRLQDLRAIVADDDGQVVTVFRDRGGRAGRRYRRR